MWGEGIVGGVCLGGWGVVRGVRGEVVYGRGENLECVGGEY